MKRAERANIWTGTIIMAALATPGAALAQTSLPAEGMDEIVVTAQRRAELSRDVPISITTLGSDQLQQANIQEVRDIPRLTPALRFDNNGAFTQPTIRGVGTSITNSGAGANVGIYVDGFYSPNPLAADIQLMNVRNIQVLKGPQGTLFGRNTTGGAILITTGQPSAQTSLLTEASYARFDAQRYQVYATTGLAEGLSFDVEGVLRKGDGFIRNIVRGNLKQGAYENWAVRTGVKFESGGASLLLRYLHSDTNDPTQVAASAYERGGRIYSSGIARPGAVAATRRGEVSIDGPTSFRNKTDTVQLTGILDLGFADLTSYTQYREEESEQFLDLDYSSAPSFHLFIPGREKIFTQELLLSSTGSDRLKWTAGLFFFNHKSDFFGNRASVNNGPFNLVSGSGTTTRAYAAFADVTYEVAERLFLTGGLRFSRDEVIDAYLVNTVTGAQVPVDDAKTNRLTPRAVVRYEIAESSSVYASFSQGYKAGILNPLGTPATQYIKPETISAYEVGYKYGDSRLTFDLAAYYYDYKNIQIASRTGSQNLLTNAADSRIMGVEGQVRYQLSDNFHVSGGIAYMEAEYRDFPTAPFYAQLPSGVFAISAIDASGFQMQRSPELTANLNARYEADLGGGRAAVSASWYHSSSVAFDAANQFVQPAYDLLGARIEWTDPSDRFTLAVFGENLADEKYRAQVNPNAFGVASVWGLPRSYGVSLRARFGAND